MQKINERKTGKPFNKPEENPAETDPGEEISVLLEESDEPEEKDIESDVLEDSGLKQDTKVSFTLLSYPLILYFTLFTFLVFRRNEIMFLWSQSFRI